MSPPIHPNVFIVCGATTWDELRTRGPIFPNAIALKDVARSFSYYCGDRRVVFHQHTRSKKNIAVYKCQRCTWTVKFVKRRGAVGKEDPWYLADNSPSQPHDAGCNPVDVLTHSDILRNSMELRLYLSENRNATQKEIETFMKTTQNIDVTQMGKGNGPFYNARNNIVSLLEIDDMDVSSIFSGGRASVSSAEQVARQFVNPELRQPPAAPAVAAVEAGAEHPDGPVNPAHQVEATTKCPSQPTYDGRNLEAQLDAFHAQESGGLATVVENRGSAIDDDEPMQPSAGMPHDGGNISTTNQSTSTSESEILREMHADLPDTTSSSNASVVEASSLTSSEEYRRQVRFPSSLEEVTERIRTASISGESGGASRDPASVGTGNDEPGMNHASPDDVGVVTNPGNPTVPYDANTNTISEQKVTGKRIRSGNTVLSGSIQPVQQRQRRLSDPTGIRTDHTMIHVANETNSHRDAQLPGSIGWSKDPSTVSSLTRSTSAPSLYTATSIPVLRLRGGKMAVADASSKHHVAASVADSKLQILHFAKQVETLNLMGEAAKMPYDVGRSMEERLAAGMDVGIAVNHNSSVISTVSGLKHRGGTFIERILSELDNQTLPVDRVKTLLDELTNRTIIEDRELCTEGVASRALEAVSGVMGRQIENERGQKLAFRREVHDLMDQIDDRRGPFSETELTNFVAGLASKIMGRKYHIGLKGIRQELIDKFAELFKEETLELRVGLADHCYTSFRNATEDLLESVHYKCFNLIVQLYEIFRSTKKCSAVIIKHTVKVLDLFRHDIRFLVRGWGSLLTTAAVDSNASISIAKEGGIPFILQCIQQYPNVADVIDGGFALLGQLAFRLPDNQRLIADVNGIDVILKAMRQNEQHVQVQQMGCLALGRLAFGNPENQRLIADGNGTGVILQAMVQHEGYAPLQEWGCHALGHLAVDNLENQLRIAHENGISVILHVMREHEQHVEIQRSGCHALGQLACEKTNNQRLIARVNGIAPILNSMQQHEQHAEIQQWGCHAMGQLAIGNQENQRLIADANGIDVILNGMRQHEKNVQVQKFGCYSIGQLACINPKNQCRIAGVNGIGVILIAMRQHEQHAEIQEWGCYAVGQLAFDSPENQRLIADANGIEVILNAMRQHEQHVKIQQWGCLSLGTLACCNPSNQRLIADASGISMILQAMGRYNEHAQLQVWGCHALGDLAFDYPENQCLIAGERGISVILHAMKQHKQTSEVQSMGCRALGQMALENMENQRLIANGNGVDMILDAMRQHEQHVEIQQWGCYSLGHVARNNPGNQRLIAYVNGIDVILNAMRQHEQHGSLQKDGCYTVGQLAFDSPENQRLIADANGIEAILNAMRRHEEHVKIQQWGCHTLGHLARENPANQHAVANASCIGEILQAMKRHGQSASVQESGCYALATLAERNESNTQMVATANGKYIIRQALRQHPDNALVQLCGGLLMEWLGQLVSSLSWFAWLRSWFTWFGIF